MGAAIIGLVGAAVGVLGTLLGGTLAQRWQDRRDQAKWRQDKRAAAYEGALRYLLRAANLRSGLTAEGGAVLKQEHQRDWFDDLVQAQFWMHVVSQYCGPDQLPDIGKAVAQLDAHVNRLVARQEVNQKSDSIWITLQHCIAAVAASARADGGDHSATSATPAPLGGITMEGKDGTALTFG